MVIALASKKFVNKDISANLQSMLACVEECAQQKIDLLCFGESFLQGFDCLDWDIEKDLVHGVSANSDIFAKISTAAKQHKVAVAFGYIEKDSDCLYSSYAVIDSMGKLIYNFKRVSVGWKVPQMCNNPFYREGNGFSTFKLMSKTISVGLCGDFWHDENLEKMRNVDCDFVLWPVFVDDEIFGVDNWAKNKFDYAGQAKKVHNNVWIIILQIKSLVGVSLQKSLSKNRVYS